MTASDHTLKPFRNLLHQRGHPYMHKSGDGRSSPFPRDTYPETVVTRRRHLVDLRSIYGYKMFTGRGARDLKTWLEGQPEEARSNEEWAR